MGNEVKRQPFDCCGYLASVETEIKTGRHVIPKKGDATICNNCGSWHRYVDDTGTTRRFDAKDYPEFSDELIRQMRAMTRVIKKRGRL